MPIAVAIVPVTLVNLCAFLASTLVPRIARAVVLARASHLAQSAVTAAMKCEIVTVVDGQAS
jgi:hypothetical protein